MSSMRSDGYAPLCYATNLQQLAKTIDFLLSPLNLIGR